MKIIDDKGRLFGKINIIDFLIVLFLLSLSPMLYFSYKIVNKNIKEAKIKQESTKEFAEIELYCLFIKVNPETAKIIKEGDRQLGEDGKPIGEIVKLSEFSPYISEFVLGSGEKLIKSDPLLRQAGVILNLRLEIRGNGLYYNNKPISNNPTFKFITDNYQVETMPISKEKIETAIADKEQAIKFLKSKIDTVEKNTLTLYYKLDGLEKRLDDMYKELGSLNGGYKDNSLNNYFHE